MAAGPDSVTEELSRAVAHRVALQEKLAATEAELGALRAEERRVRAYAAERRGEAEELHRRIADLRGALNAARGEKAAPPEAAGEAEAEAAPPPKLRALPGAPVIEVSGLSKSYRLPGQPVDTLKERVLHPLRARRGERLEALRDVSFEVRRGEFFGIAGANGSGKSTLLKLLANVYAADSGSIRTAGRVAPFIELGVGLNPEFKAYDNVLISGVMMGLDPEQARERFPRIIAFAGLEDFTELKLKNYSSGMRVRLAFSVMAEVDADVLLVDEVLAVGDAEFRAKCLARMDKLREEGKTIVLVTHSMETLGKRCDRGIFLADGEVRAEGDPAEIARVYMEAAAGKRPSPLGESPVKLVGA